MKISKIPGLGRFGIFVDDLNFTDITDEKWIEFGKLHLDSLVTICRNVTIETVEQFETMFLKWGPTRNASLNYFSMKYGENCVDAFFKKRFSKEDRKIFNVGKNLLLDKDRRTMMVSGRKDGRGRPLGLFGTGGLKWHSNESGNIIFIPGVALLGKEFMTNSCTGFVTTTDWYEKQSESFRSELDSMIVVHKYQRNSINTDGIDEDSELFYKTTMCPEEGTKMPLVIQSPGGIKGLHLPPHTFESIEGMSRHESDKLFDTICSGIFVEEYMYEHWYPRDNDLCIFDNSIVLHKRDIKPGESSEQRLAWRFPFDYENIAGNYNPFFQEEYNLIRSDLISASMELLNAR